MIVNNNNLSWLIFSFFYNTIKFKLNSLNLMFFVYSSEKKEQNVLD